MRNILKKANAVLLTAILLLGLLAVPQTGFTVHAARTVRKVKAVDSLTGSNKIYLAKGKTAKLKVTVTLKSKKVTSQKVTYKSSNKKVASVNKKGLIKGKMPGTAKITITAKANRKKKAAVTVKVVKGQVKSVKLNQPSETLTVGDTVKLKAAVNATKGGWKKVVWYSSDKKVAVVEKGRVTAIGEGTAVITAKATDGSGKKDTCTVMVKKKEADKTPEDDKNPEQPPEDEKPLFPAEKNASDIAALKAIINEQKELGAKIPDDPETPDIYTWDETTGRLTGINWDKCSLQGDISFESLPALKELKCFDNQLTNLDISKNTALEKLDCSWNYLTSLDVSQNTALTSLDCFTNSLRNLDVSENTALKELDCHNINLETLDMSGNPALITLDCSFNPLKKLNVMQNTALEDLNCRDTQLVSLFVGNNKALKRLNCSGYSMSDRNPLTKLNINNNTALEELDCSWGQLEHLYVRNNTALKILNCFGNYLPKLDVSQNVALTELNCSYNQLENLNVSQNTALERLSCHKNNLTSLDVTNCENLTYLGYDMLKIANTDLKGWPR